MKEQIHSYRGRACGIFKEFEVSYTFSPAAQKEVAYSKSPIVLPISEYCLVVWDPSTVILNKKLERVPNYAAYMIVDKPPWTSSEEL